MGNLTLSQEEEILNIKNLVQQRVNEINVIVHTTLVMQGQASPFVRKSEACRLYGRKNIEKWTRWGLIEWMKDGENNSQLRCELSKLIMIAGAANRNEYFKNKVV